MTTAYTSLLGLALPTTGELQGTWGDTVNNSITSLLDSAVAGTTTLSTDGDVTLSTTTGAANQARQAILLCSGARTAIRTITAPAQSKIYTVINNTTGGYAVKLVGVGPTTGVSVPAGSSGTFAWNGSDFVDVSNYVSGNKIINGNLTVNGNTTLGDASTDSLTINAKMASNLLFTDNTYDIGASGANRPRDMFMARNLTVGGTSTLTGNTAIGGTYSGTATLRVFNTAAFDVYMATTQRYLQLNYDTTPSSAWSFGNIDQSSITLTTDFTFSAFDGSTWAKPNVLRLRTNGNVSMKYNLSVASTDSNPWGGGFNTIQLYDLTAGAVSGSGYAGYFSTNTYNNGTNWIQVGASWAPAQYRQFDGQHTFYTASSAGAGGTISPWVTVLETLKTGAVSIPGFLGINATPNSTYRLRIGNDGVQMRLERASATRYRSDFNISSAGLEINAYDDSGGVYMPMFYAGSSHTWGYGNSNTTAASISTGGLFSTVLDAQFNGVPVGKGNSSLSNNVAVGNLALSVATTGNYNTAVGSSAGRTITTSSYNVAVGNGALAGGGGARNVTGADGSTAVGVNALFNLGSGNVNTAFGRDAGYTNQTGSYNVYVGLSAGFSHTGSYGVYMGYNAGYSETGNNNVYVGNQAGQNSSGNTYNTFIGDEAGRGHTSGSNNTFVGTGAAYGSNTLTNTLIIGQYNTGTNHGPGELLTSGSNNTYVGGFDGNQSTLDTRGLSQQVVISDGAGYPVFHNNVTNIATNNFGHIDVTFNSATTGNVLAAASGTAISLFGGGNNFSGLIYINDINLTGSSALFIVGGTASIFKISESSSSNFFQATSTPTGSNTGCYMSGNAFTIKQNSGGTVNYRIIAFRTRVSL